MTIPEICIFLAAIMPYVVVSFAKSSVRDFDNGKPRDKAHFSEYAVRADNAHQNSFESFPLFAISVIIAELYGVNHMTLSVLAVIFILVRIAYVYLYLQNFPTYRSIAFTLGLIITSGIFFLPLIQHL